MSGAGVGSRARPLRCFGGAALFDGSAGLRHAIGAEPLGHRKQSICDLGRALDRKRLGAEQLAVNAHGAPEDRRFLGADRYSRLQTASWAPERTSAIIMSASMASATRSSLSGTRDPRLLLENDNSHPTVVDGKKVITRPERVAVRRA